MHLYLSLNHLISSIPDFSITDINRIVIFYYIYEIYQRLPETNNPYVYVLNTPVKHKDPNGLWVGALIGGTTAIISNYDAYASGEMSGFDYGLNIGLGIINGLVGPWWQGAIAIGFDMYAQWKECNGKINMWHAFKEGAMTAGMGYFQKHLEGGLKKLSRPLDPYSATRYTPEWVDNILIETMVEGAGSLPSM